MKDRFGKQFLLASAVILSLVSSILWSSLKAIEFEQSASQKIEQIVEVQRHAQDILVRAFELQTAAETVNIWIAQQSLRFSAQSLIRASDGFSTENSPVRQFVRTEKMRVDSTDIHDKLVRRITDLAISAQGMADAETFDERASSFNLIRAQANAYLFIDIRKLVDLSKEELRHAVSLLHSLYMIALPIMVGTLTLIWLVMIRPLVQRHDRHRMELQTRAEDARQLAKQAQAANVAKSNFLAVMSHEIRTPMNGVLGFAELIHATSKDPKSVEMAQVIKDSGGSLVRILDDILDAAKIEAGNIDLEEVEFRPSGVAETLERLFQVNATSKGVSYSVDLLGAGQTPRLGDSHRLAKIATNLVGNAMKFTENGGIRVLVDCRSPEYLTLRVEDDGIGMDDDQLDNIFDAFQQADSSTTRRFGGTGLGLAIVKDLVELMGGTVSIDSEVGRGTTAMVAFPMAEVSGEIEDGGETGPGDGLGDGTGGGIENGVDEKPSGVASDTLKAAS